MSDYHWMAWTPDWEAADEDADDLSAAEGIVVAIGLSFLLVVGVLGVILAPW
jgi:hypothetical protein